MSSIIRLPDEPIIIVTLEDPLSAHNSRHLLRQLLRLTQDIEDTVYCISDLRAVTLCPSSVETLLLQDIHFTSWQVRSVVVGVGAMIDLLVAHTHTHFYQPTKMMAFPQIETALAQLRWEMKHTAHPH